LAGPRRSDRFDEYLAAGDLVGADVARKFLKYTQWRSEHRSRHG
jgi:hypothetical protein